MACFIVPTTEAVISTIVTKVVKAKEKKHGINELCVENNLVKNNIVQEFQSGEIKKIPFSRKLSWLSNMLWSGSALLAFEHMWHGEVTPWFPFLTAASNPTDLSAMLHEMATVGVIMAVLVTAIWCVLVGVTAAMEKHALQEKNNCNQLQQTTEVL